MKGVLVFLFSLAFGASQSEIQQIEQAHEAINSIRKHFKKEISKEPGKCTLMAPQFEIKNDQMEVGRTSHQLRNPKNQPRDWVKPLLDDYVRTPVSKHPKNKLIQLGPNHYGYVEPIYVEAICLNCHGSHLKPEVRKEILEIYPSDKATGFKIGDFRGLIWLESRIP